MFILTTISDLVQISPEDLEKPSAEAIEDNLNTKYSNKVIQKIGLCICVYDILSASDGLIGHGTGVINVNVEFRLIVFRPFKGEIITGRIAGATEAGIRVSLDFFEDIWVPSHLLFSDSSFNAAEQTWVWHSESGDFYFDRNEWVRVRVETEQWHDLSPVAPAEREAVNSFNNHTGTRLGRMVVMALVISGEDCASDEFNVGECY
ncbi:MAG: DNA-directed RNA polymerase III subunit rpc25 [Heterodermia speciosa]|uniref:DNA-directed RNA polymerase subunit n=1 Tax=Heterodermia speciosa TaxID=116794 RepID=A0A8H3EKQ2_9LECA|nr:MAG: DNA-directed RNA polymerase III subunit rpc25 [Heterodermia speciosa]